MCVLMPCLMHIDHLSFFGGLLENRILFSILNQDNILVEFTVLSCYKDAVTTPKYAVK